MKTALVALLLVGLASAAPRSSGNCDPQVCKLPNCRCTGTDIPGGLNAKDIPQMVFLTFDDAVTAINYDYYKQAFFNRTNPDGCPITTSYFVSHEYTDYTLVHDLKARGHEIALHSITHTSATDYWKNLTVQQLVQEFKGEIELISKFANISKDSIKGQRVPLLQLSGNNTILAMKEVGLEWDCSWPTRTYTSPGLWPYTFDYGHAQDCPIDPCPHSDLQVPGVWEIPMLMWFDNINVTCSMVDACTNITSDVQGIYNFMVKNFETQYQGNRAPVGVYMHAAWFGQKENAFEAYIKFLDYLQSKPDVYLVNVSKGLEWVKNPQPLNKLANVWPKCEKTFEPSCIEAFCQLKKGEEERWMKLCGACPAVYPWLGNPLGQKQ